MILNLFIRVHIYCISSKVWTNFSLLNTYSSFTLILFLFKIFTSVLFYGLLSLTVIMLLLFLYIACFCCILFFRITVFIDKFIIIAKTYWQVYDYCLSIYHYCQNALILSLLLISLSLLPSLIVHAYNIINVYILYIIYQLYVLYKLYIFCKVTWAVILKRKNKGSNKNYNFYLINVLNARLFKW